MPVPTAPLVSIVMAVRNGERYLAAAMNSILDQCYHPMEILFVDGRSTDRSREIAASYPWVRILKQPGTGIADAYNLGIIEAQGEYLAFLSHDDIWTSDKLHAQVGHLNRNPQVHYVVGKARLFLDPGCKAPPALKSGLLYGDHVAFNMETLLVRRHVFNSVGLFNTSLTMGEDTDWFLRGLDLGMVGEVLPRVILHKRVHDANIWLNTPEYRQILIRIVKQSLQRKRNRAAGGSER